PEPSAASLSELSRRPLARAAVHRLLRLRIGRGHSERRRGRSRRDVEPLRTIAARHRQALRVSPPGGIAPSLAHHRARGNDLSLHGARAVSGADGVEGGGLEPPPNQPARSRPGGGGERRGIRLPGDGGAHAECQGRGGRPGGDPQDLGLREPTPTALVPSVRLRVRPYRPPRSRSASSQRHHPHSEGREFSTGQARRCGASGLRLGRAGAPPARPPGARPRCPAAAPTPPPPPRPPARPPPAPPPPAPPPPPP